MLISPFTRILKNAGILLSANVLASLAGFVALLLTARGLGAKEFGFLVLVQAYVAIYGLVISFQTWQPVIKFGSELIEVKDYSALNKQVCNALLIDVVAALFGSLLALFVIFIAADYFNWSVADKIVIVICLFTVLSNVSGAFSGVLRLLDEFKLIGKVQVVFSLTRLGMVLLAFFYAEGVFGYALAWACSEMVSHALTILLGLKSYKKVTGKSFRIMRPDFRGQGNFIRFMLANNIDVSLRMVSRQLDVVLLGFLAGKEQVAAYKVAVHLCSIPLRFTDPIYQALLPEFARLNAKGQDGAARKMVLSILRIAFPVFLCVYALFWMVGYPVVGLLFGDEYISVFSIMSVYLWAVAGAMVGLPFVPYFHSRGDARLCLNIQLIATAFYLSVLYFLIALFGAAGAAAAYVTYYVAWLCVAFYFYYIRRVPAL